MFKSWRGPLCCVSLGLLMACQSQTSAPEAPPAKDAAPVEVSDHDHEPQAKVVAKATMPNRMLAERVDPDAEFSKLRYLDTDAVTLNDRCPVRKIRLNPKMEAVYVNGRAIGFC